MKIKAIGHRIIVKPDPVEKKTASGIILNVDGRREVAATQKGTVIEVGPMAWKNTYMGYGIDGWEPWCKAGDRVFFARHVGKVLRLTEDVNDEEFYMILNDEDIQAIIEEE